MNAHTFLKIQALKTNTTLTDISAELGYSTGYFWTVIKSGKKGYQVIFQVAEWLDEHGCDGEEFLSLSMSEHDEMMIRGLSKERRKIISETFARLWEEEQKERKEKAWRA